MVAWIGDIQFHETRIGAFGLQLFDGRMAAGFIPRAHQHFDLFRAQPARDLKPDSFVRAADERDVALKEFHVWHKRPVYTIRSM